MSKSRFQADLRTRQITDPEARDSAHATKQAIEEMRGVEIMDGRQILATLTTGGATNKVKHGLGRKARGHSLMGVMSASSTAITAAGSIVQVAGAPDDELWLAAFGYTGPTQIKATLWVY